MTPPRSETYDLTPTVACPRCGDEVRLLIILRPQLIVRSGRSWIEGVVTGQRIVDHECKDMAS